MSEKLTEAGRQLRALRPGPVKDALVGGVLPWMAYEEASRQQLARKVAELEASIEQLLEGNGGTPGPEPEPEPTNVVRVPIGTTMPRFGTAVPGTRFELERGGQWQRIDLGGGKDFQIGCYGDSSKPLPRVRGGGIFVPANSQRIVMENLDIADCSIGMNVVPNAGVRGLVLRNSYIANTTDSGIIDYSEGSTFSDLVITAAGSPGTASHGIYANGRGTTIRACKVVRAAKNGISLRMDGQTVVANDVQGTSIGIAYFTELAPGTSDIRANRVEDNKISGCSVAMYISAAGGWPGGQEPAKPWVYPPFDINRNAISGPIGMKQGIMCEIPVRSHQGNTFEGDFSVKERYP
jgi:Periplasmic copper-binding protein (NosD)